ncbi:uncharacterized protein LOC144196651 [Stigmatopora nigra]
MNRRQSYYEGYLEKRSFKDKKSRKMWTCLCGNMLYFYNDKRDSDFTEKLDLNGLVTIADDNTLDHNLDVAKLNLQTEEGIVKICAPNAENRELWKGLIQSVAELSVPSMLNLLPGQIRMLEDVVKKEKERLHHVQQHSPVPGGDFSPDMPNCFHPVTRVEAELLLQKEISRGNLLLRRSRNGNGFAISTREEMNGPIFKHYHVSPAQDDRFSIDVDNPVVCTSLHEVVNYFLEATEGALKTLVREETYEKNIYYVSLNDENGERRVRGANSSVHAPPQGFQRKQALLRLPSGEQEENVYVNEDIHENSTMEPSPGESLLFSIQIFFHHFYNLSDPMTPKCHRIICYLKKIFKNLFIHSWLNSFHFYRIFANKCFNLMSFSLSPEPETKEAVGKLPKAPVSETKEAAGKLLPKSPTSEAKEAAGKLPKAPTSETKKKLPKASAYTLTADAKVTAKGTSPDTKEATRKKLKTPTPAPRKTQPSTPSPTLKASHTKDNKMKHQTEPNINAAISELMQKFEKNPK